MMLTDENGECIETATNLKAKFEALRLLEEAKDKQEQQPAAKKFAPKRFKVGNEWIHTQTPPSEPQLQSRTIDNWLLATNYVQTLTFQ